MDRAGASRGAFRGGLRAQPGESEMREPSLETYSRHRLEKVCFRTLLAPKTPGETAERPKSNGHLKNTSCTRVPTHIDHDRDNDHEGSYFLRG